LSSRKTELNKHFVCFVRGKNYFWHFFLVFIAIHTPLMVFFGANLRIGFFDRRAGIGDSQDFIAVFTLIFGPGISSLGNFISTERDAPA
jgi:hypothetical protein